MRISSPARAAANVLAAVLILAALPARGGTPVPAPDEVEAGATEAEEPSRSWNLLDADDAAPRIPRHPIRDRLREKQRERRRIAPA
ncbi:MAG: hypothetical protein ACREBE_07665, partial [bacterium]